MSFWYFLIKSGTYYIANVVSIGFDEVVWVVHPVNECEKVNLWNIFTSLIFSRKNLPLCFFKSSNLLPNFFEIS